MLLFLADLTGARQQDVNAALLPYLTHMRDPSAKIVETANALPYFSNQSSPLLAAADTDGDGIADGRDSLPQVAMLPGRSPRAEALAYVSGNYTLGRGAIITGIIDSDEEKNACVLRQSLIGESTLFMIGDRSAFAPLDLPHRVIVLTRGEHELYEKKFGPTYGASMHNFVADRLARASSSS